MRWLAVKTREPDTSSLGWLADCWTTWCTCSTHTHSTGIHCTHMHTCTLYMAHTYIHIVIKDVAGACMVYSHSAATSAGLAYCSLLYSMQRLPSPSYTSTHMRSPSHTSTPHAAHVTCTAQPAASTAVARVRIHSSRLQVWVYKSLRISVQSIPKRSSPDLGGDESAPRPE